MTWLIPREELTADQLRAIESNTDEHRLIMGAAGSGKTQVLLHRAHFLRNLLGTSADRFHIFVYTNVLREYIQSALALLNLPKECVSTIDAWCLDFYKAFISQRIPWTKGSQQPDFDAVRAGVLTYLNSGRLPKPIFDFVLVDEGQDLDDSKLQILVKIAKHVTLCADPRQQIYDQGSSIKAISDRLGVGARNVSLLETFRCCPYIVDIASEFIDDPEERSQFAQLSRTTQTERETPLLYHAPTADDETQRMVEIIKTRQTTGDRIGILFYQARQANGFAKPLREAGLEVETPKRDLATGTFAELNFNSDLPKLLTYHGAKGLTFDTVIIPRLVPTTFGGVAADRINRLLFVAITRALKWVYLSTVSGHEIEALQKLQGPGNRGKLMIQHGGNVPGPARSGPTKSSPKPDILDF